MDHNNGTEVLTRSDRISIQSAEHTVQGFTWIYDNWLIVLALVVFICVIGVATGKVKVR